MTFPTPPPVDLPKWCYAGGVYLEPPLSQRETGWVAVSGQNYAEPPPYQWVNWLGYSTGAWVEYLAAYALPYIAAGKFDAGLELYNNQPAKFYNAANDKYTSIKSSPSQSAASVPLVLPPALPATPLPMVSDSSGTMSFSTISSSAVAGITNGSVPINGQIGQYYLNNGSNTVTENTSNLILIFLNLGPGIWKISATASVDIPGGATVFQSSTLTIFFNSSASVPLPSIKNYNFAVANNISAQYQVFLNNYILNISTTSPLYFLCNFYHYTAITTSVYYSFFAQRIA